MVNIENTNSAHKAVNSLSPGQTFSPSSANAASPVVHNRAMFRSAMNDAALNSYLHKIHAADLNQIAAKDIVFSAAVGHKAPGSITEIKPGLLTGALITSDGKTVYFAREELKTKDDQDRWKNFLEIEYLDLKALGYASLLTGSEKTETEIDQAFRADKQFNNLELNAQTTSDYLKNTVKNINPLPEADPYHEQTGKLFNAYIALEGFKPYSKKDEKSYALYASNKQVTDFAFHDLPDAQGPHHLSDTLSMTSHISICVGNKVSKDCSEHRGISKMPMPLLNKLKADFNIPQTNTRIPNTKIPLSIALHFFGMKCQQAGKIGYFTVAPFGAMSNLMRKALSDTDQIKHFAYGPEAIKERGWLQHIRQVDLQKNGAMEDVCVGHLAKIEIPLWRDVRYLK